MPGNSSASLLSAGGPSPFFSAMPACGDLPTVFNGTGYADGKTKSDFMGLFFENGKGLIQESYASLYDAKTQKWMAGGENTYLTSIHNAATTPAAGTAYYLKVQNTGATDANISTDIENQYTNDATFLSRTEQEFCYYFGYYSVFLEKFLSALTSNDAKAQEYLEILISLNAKINALVLLVDYIANGRSGYVFARGAALDELNKRIQDTVASSPVSSNTMLSKENVLNTRKEMIRYTKEKNNSISNHISLWAALNVVAIAMIFTLYRKM